MRVAGFLLLSSLIGCTCAGPKIQVVREDDAGLPPECIVTVELCNGRDDDCDGAIDEEQPMLECGIGAFSYLDEYHILCMRIGLKLPVGVP